MPMVIKFLKMFIIILNKILFSTTRQEHDNNIKIFAVPIFTFIYFHLLGLDMEYRLLYVLIRSVITPKVSFPTL